MGWTGPLTHRQLLVWIQFERLFREGDKPDISLAGVPTHIRQRWERRVGGAGYSFASAQERAVRARRIAVETGRDEGVVFDELTAREQLPAACN